MRYLKKKILANSAKPISIGIVVFVGGAETKFQTYFPDFILGEKNLLGLKPSYLNKTQIFENTVYFGPI